MTSHFTNIQIPDLVSHTGRTDLARDVFSIIERFVGKVLESIDPQETIVVVTSDHGHLEQVDFLEGHPKSKVPTWYFRPNAEERAARLRRPESIFHLFADLESAVTG
jgi:bisphosphoglycerate-independent phosphoglycerate mutase (AlkP superfamily)